MAALPEDERPKFEKQLAASAARWHGELPPTRTEVVKKWTLDELAQAWSEAKAKPDPANGKKLFAAARCIVCHRCGEPGGVSGPDLTSVARRFSPRDVLASIIEPSQAIDEKYAADVFELTDGRILTGRVAPGDYRAPDLEIVPDLLEPEKSIKFAKADIARRTPSTVSAMPSGLLDQFTEAEILDLVAYLLSAGQSAIGETKP